VVEAQAAATVTAADGVLDIDSAEGITLWFREPLVAPVAIEYDVLAVAEGGPDDAVSDVNAFWMATDPAVPDGSVLARRRSGTFADYDLIRTYYTGIGGNRNTTTRMRRYIGAAGNRPLLPEHDRSDAAALLVPNRWMHVRLTADAQRRDGRARRGPPVHARGPAALCARAFRTADDQIALARSQLPGAGRLNGHRPASSASPIKARFSIAARPHCAVPLVETPAISSIGFSASGPAMRRDAPRAAVSCPSSAPRNSLQARLASAGSLRWTAA
jgi:hypothetical protein